MVIGQLYSPHLFKFYGPSPIQKVIIVRAGFIKAKVMHRVQG